MEGQRKVITIVCTGNVCRSPMAERLLRHALSAEPEPLRSIKVVSAGVSAFPGDPASGHAIAAMRKVNIDLGDHRSRSLSDPLMDISDLILTMTTGHVDMINMQYPEHDKTIHLFREWIPSGSKEVPDPVGGPLDLFT